MSFLQLCLLNVATRKTRAALTGVAIAISIAMVMTMGVLTHSLRETAINILRTGEADFSIAQRGLSDVLYSAVDEEDVAAIDRYDGVASTIGVLVAPWKLDSDHPFFLRIGLQPEQLEPFGVEILLGRPFTAAAENEIMLGYRAARELKKSIGDTIELESVTYTIVGVYSTGQVFGDSASMLPLAHLQGVQRKPGVVTLVLVRVEPGTDIDPLRDRIEKDRPELATVRTQSDFGRVDRNLKLISAANTGVSALALVIGAVSVMNTMMLTVFERTREFGVLRAIGWARLRVLTAVLSEAMIVTFASAAVGIGLGFLAVRLLEDAPDLVGLFDPIYPGAVFARALAIAFGTAFIGAIYPAARAALLVPLQAIRHE